MNQLDSQKIAGYVKELEDARDADPELHEEIAAILAPISSKKKLSLLDMVKAVGGEAQRVIRENRTAEEKVKAIEGRAAVEKMPFAEDDNYYSILSRTFSLMLRTIANLQLAMYRPDVLVKMSFDSYSTITDYAKGEEIAEKGRALMAEALDRYETTSLQGCRR